MRLMHTSDWHLGQTLHGQERDYEHRCFLQWLLKQLVQHAVDALLIAGDVFDHANPSLAAQKQLYDFIMDAHQQCPQLHIVMIAGNHDSGARIELPAPLMRRLNAHAIGRIHWLNGQPDGTQLLLPLPNAQGVTTAWCLALPFLRPSEITGLHSSSDYLTAMHALHAQLIAYAEQQRQPGQALIALSHAHLAGGQVSEDSERSLIIGTAEALPATLFPESLHYVALGHLHRPQRVAGQERLRYSGSPIPLSFAEINYPHQVLLVTVQGEQLQPIEPLLVPRAVALVRLGPAPLAKLLKELHALPPHTGPRETQPWLEIQVQLDEPQPGLRLVFEQALKDKGHRLVRLHSEYPNRPDAPAEALPNLEHITPQELFCRAWTERFGQPPSDPVRHDFALLVQQIQQDEVVRP